MISSPPRTSTPPSQPSEQLQWLVDRAAISDLLIDFARCLDVRDWDGYVANFTEDAQLVLPFATFNGRRDIEQNATHGLDAFDATVHMSTNHIIDIDGDVARTRSYLCVAHVPDAKQPDEHGDAGGWYDCVLSRTPDSWKLSSATLHIAWIRGTAFPH